MSTQLNRPDRTGSKYPRRSKRLKAHSRRNYTGIIAGLGSLCALISILIPVCIAGRSEPETPPPAMTRILKAPEAQVVLGAADLTPTKSNWHPSHRIKVWKTYYKGRKLCITQLPHCEHLETLISYEPSGETLRRAKARLGGIAACSGSFHNPQTMALADFLQRKGSIISGAKTGRSFVCIDENGRLDISDDYTSIKCRPDVSALALGQRLLPLQKDGFSAAFMNRKTDRMAIGLNSNYIFIVQGQTDIWRLASFFKHKLPVQTAINCDGGHVVRGKAPVHIVFRWSTDPASSTCIAKGEKPVADGDRDGG